MTLTREEVLKRRLDADIRNLAHAPSGHGSAPATEGLLWVLADCAEHYIEARDYAPALVFRAEGALRLAVKRVRGEK